MECSVWYRLVQSYDWEWCTPHALDAPHCWYRLRRLRNPDQNNTARVPHLERNAGALVFKIGHVVLFSCFDKGFLFGDLKRESTTGELIFSEIESMAWGSFLYPVHYTAFFFCGIFQNFIAAANVEPSFVVKIFLYLLQGFLRFLVSIITGPFHCA